MIFAEENSTAEKPKKKLETFNPRATPRHFGLFDPLHATAPRSIGSDQVALPTVAPPPVIVTKPEDKQKEKKDWIFASPGEQFGPGGESWLRFNFATPRPILAEALDRLDDAFRDLRS